MFLQLFQAWALAFQSKPALTFLVDVYNELKNSGELRSPRYPCRAMLNVVCRCAIPTARTGQRRAVVDHYRANMGRL